MKYLLDTHTFIWSVLDTKQLSADTRKILKASPNEILVSTISFWEISLKTSIKKYAFTGLEIEKMPSFAREMGFSIATLSETESSTFHHLPLIESHKDPFDRMLIWQSICRNAVMLSKDSSFLPYREHGLQLAW